MNAFAVIMLVLLIAGSVAGAAGVIWILRKLGLT